ncbi:hypothetical protein [Winogradskyella sp. UBA3174]|uniref:hypothetical protein n=1 Tax=Winogradskyella sp. UBA3174 TaxID=1947785 RepID=UPI0025EB71C8|nr:hypothetical protein [Winogradskyella sp. UBA3174]|tara:strand:+ start:850 stop:1023 length:174 start_codon:yes stop_codon:yes gene_type:complete
MFPAALASASFLLPIIEPITIPLIKPREIPNERSRLDKIATPNSKPKDNPKPPYNFV